MALRQLRRYRRYCLLLVITLTSNITMSSTKAQIYLYTRDSQSSRPRSFSTARFRFIISITETFPKFRHWGVMIKFPNGTCKVCEAREENLLLKGRIGDVSEHYPSDTTYLGETEVTEEELDDAVEALNGIKRKYLLTHENCKSWVKDLCQCLRVSVDELSSVECGLFNPIVDEVCFGVNEMRI